MENPLRNRLPEVLTAAAVLTGLTGAADTLTGGKYGIRNFLPEPLDLPDHGMSMAMGAAISSAEYPRLIRKGDTAPDIRVAVDPAVKLQIRSKSVSTARRKIAGCAVGAITAASVYIGLGEVGSEALHFVYDKQHEAIPVQEREPLPLGHFDPLDILYGVGTAALITNLRRRQDSKFLDEIAQSLPPPKQKPNRVHSSKPSPKANRRYTPPKSKQ